MNLNQRARPVMTFKRRFERSGDPDVQINVASAIWDLAWALVNFGKVEAALRECKELEIIFDGIKGGSP